MHKRKKKRNRKRNLRASRRCTRRSLFEQLEPRRLFTSGILGDGTTGIADVSEPNEIGAVVEQGHRGDLSPIVMSTADLQSHDVTLRFVDEGEASLQLVDSTTQDVLWQKATPYVDAIDIIGQDNVDDMLRLDFSAADADDGLKVNYDGGSGGYDCLSFVGQPGMDVDYTAIGASGGTISLQADHWQSEITFTGLEPVAIDGNGADYSFSTMAGSEDILKVDKLDSATNRISGTSAGTAFETVEFTDVGTLTLQTGTEDDRLSIEDEIVGASTFAIDLGSGNDRVEINRAAGADLADLQAGSGEDQLIVNVPDGGYAYNAIEGISGTNPVSVTVTNHGLSTGDSVTITDVEGKTSCNGTHTVTRVDRDTFTLDGVTDSGTYVSGTGTIAGAAITDRLAVSGWKAYYHGVEESLVEKTATGSEGLVGIDGELAATLNTLADYFSQLERHPEFAADLPIVGLSMSDVSAPGHVFEQLYTDYQNSGSAGDTQDVVDFFWNWMATLSDLDPAIDASTSAVNVSVFEDVETGTVNSNMIGVDWTLETQRDDISGSSAGTSLLSRAGISFPNDPSWSFDADFTASLSLLIDADGSNQTLVGLDEVSAAVVSTDFGLSGEPLNLGVLGATMQTGGGLSMAKSAAFSESTLSRSQLAAVDSLADVQEQIDFVGTASGTIPFSVDSSAGFTVVGGSLSGEVQIGVPDATMFGPNAASSLPVTTPRWATNLTAYTPDDLLDPLKNFANWLGHVPNTTSYETAVPFAEDTEIADLFDYREAFTATVIDPLTTGDAVDFSTLQDMVAAVDIFSMTFDPDVGEVAINADVTHAGTTVTAPVVLNLTRSLGSIESISGTGVTGDPITVTLSGHGLSTGDSVTISGVGGKVGCNGTFTVTNLDADRFVLDEAVCDRDYVGGGSVAVVASGDLQQVSGGEVAISPNSHINFDYGLDGKLDSQVLSLQGADSTLFPQNGILGEDATFTVDVDGTGYGVTVTAAATGDNENLADLLQDINASLPAGVRAVLDSSQGTYHLCFVPENGQNVAVHGANTSAENTLGLNQVSSAVRAANSPVVFDVSSDAVMDITVGNETRTITISAANTDGNESLENTRDDLNTALSSAFSTGITASVENNRMTLHGETNPLSINSANSEAQDLLGFLTGQSSNSLLANNPLTTPRSHGSLQRDLVFSLETGDSAGPQQITVSAAATADNTSLTALREDIQNAINNSPLAGVDVAVDSGRLRFNHTGTFLRFTADASMLGGQAALDVLGLQSGDTAEAATQTSLWANADTTSVEGHFTAAFSQDPASVVYNNVRIDLDAPSALSEEGVLRHAFNASGQLDANALLSTELTTVTAGDADGQGHQVNLQLEGAATLDDGMDGSSRAFVLGVTLADIADITSTEISTTVVDDVIANMRLQGVVDALAGVYDKFFQETAESDILTGVLPFINLAGTDANSFATAYCQAVSQTESWMQTQDIPTLQALQQTLNSELSQRLDTRATAFSFTSGSELDITVTGTHSESAARRFFADLGSLEDLSGQDLENIPETGNHLVPTSSVVEIDVSTTADFSTGTRVTFDSPNNSQTELLGSSQVTLDLTAEKTDLTFDAMVGTARFNGITGSVIVDADGAAGGPAAQYNYALDQNTNIAEVSTADITVSLIGSATLVLDAATWDETLEIDVPSLQDLTLGHNGSVNFGTPIPDLDVGVTNEVFELLRDPSNLVSGVSQVFGDIIMTVNDGFNALGNIPLIGEEISDITDPFFTSLNNVRVELTDSLLAAVSEATDANSGGVLDIYQELLYDTFHETLGILNDRVDDGDNVVTKDDIVITVGSPEDELAQFDMHLGQSYELTVPFDGLSLKLGDLELDDIMPDFGFSIEAPNGIQIDFEWALRLGFGVSALEGFYLNGEAKEFSHDIYPEDWHYDATTDSLTFTTDEQHNPNAPDVEELFFSIDVTTPGLSTNVALGLIQGELTDGTEQATSITLPGTPGGEYFEIDDPMISFGNQDFDLEIITYDADFNQLKSTRLTYSADDDWSDIDNMLEFIQQLNVDLIDEQITVVPNLDDFMEPSLIFRARSAEIKHMEIRDYAKTLGMDATPEMEQNLDYLTMYEDQRTFGLGFTGEEAYDGSGLTAQLEAPWGGQLSDASTMSKDFEVGGNLSSFAHNTAFTLNVGGTDVAVGAFMGQPVWGEDIYTQMSLEGLRERLARALEVALGEAGLESDAVTVELVDSTSEEVGPGEFRVMSGKLRFVSSQSLSVAVDTLDHTRVRIAGAIDLGNIDDSSTPPAGLGYQHRAWSELDESTDTYVLEPSGSVPSSIDDVDFDITWNNAITVNVGWIKDAHNTLSSHAEFAASLQAAVNSAFGAYGIPEGAVEVYVNPDNQIGFRSDAPLKVVFNDPDDDGKVNLPELFSGSSMNFELEGYALTRFDVDANMQHIDDFLANAISSFSIDGFDGFGLPRVLFELKMDLGFTVSFPDYSGDSPLEYEIGELRFDMVQVDLGKLMDSIVKPVVGGVLDVIGPVLDVVGNSQDVAGWITEDLPVLDDLGIDVSVADVIGLDAEQIDKFYDAVGALIELKNVIDGWSGDQDAMLQLGCWAADLDPESDTFIGKIKVPLPCEVFEMQEGIENAIEDNELLNAISMASDAGGFQLAILEPSSIMNMLMGRPFDIVGYTLPELNLTAGIDVGFDAGPLGFNIDVGGRIAMDPVGIMYDSTGLEKIITAFQNDITPDPLDVLDGFYVPNSVGPEFSLEAWARGGGEVDLVIASVGAKVWLEGGISFDILDPNEDNKLRLEEILGVTEDFTHPENIIWLFDSTVSLGGGFEAWGSLGPLKLSVSGDFDVSLTLSDIIGSFFEKPDYYDPVLGEFVDNAGTLRLNCGPHASSRVFGDVVDDGPVSYTVSGSSGNLLISDGLGNSYEISDPVNTIVATGTEFNDTFDLSGVNDGSIVVQIEGKDGNDFIIGGSGNDLLVGGRGNDILEGGPGSDTLKGGRGDDTLRGQGGPDHLYGGRGDDALYGGSGDDHYVFASLWGADSVSEQSHTDTGDTIDLSGVFSPLAVSIGSRYQVQDQRRNENSITTQGMEIEHFVSGLGDDTFSISGGSDHSAVLDGNKGADTYEVSFGSGVDNFEINDQGFLQSSQYVDNPYPKNDGRKDWLKVAGDGSADIAFYKNGNDHRVEQDGEQVTFEHRSQNLDNVEGFEITDTSASLLIPDVLEIKRDLIVTTEAVDWSDRIHAGNVDMTTARDISIDFDIWARDNFGIRLETTDGDILQHQGLYSAADWDTTVGDGSGLIQLWAPTGRIATDGNGWLTSDATYENSFASEKDFHEAVDWAVRNKKFTVVTSPEGVPTGQIIVSGAETYDPYHNGLQLRDNDGAVIQSAAGSLLISAQELAGQPVVLDDAKIPTQYFEASPLALFTDVYGIAFEVTSGGLANVVEMNEIYTTRGRDIVEGDDRFGGDTGVLKLASLGGSQFITQPIQGNSQDIELVGDSIEILENIESQGANLTLIPASTNRTIGIGDSAPGDFNLTQTELNRLTNGFRTIYVGRPNGIHNIAVGSHGGAPVEIRDPLVLRNPNGGQITINSSITGSDNASLTIVGSGHTTIVSADDSVPGEINIGDAVEIEGDITLVSTGSFVTMGTPGDRLDAFDDVGTTSGIVSNTDDTDTLTLNAATSVLINGPVGHVDPLEGLSVNAGTNVTFEEAVTIGDVDPDADLTVTAEGNVIFKGPVEVADDLVIDAPGSVTFRDHVTVGGEIRIIGAQDAEFQNSLTVSGNIEIEADQIDFGLETGSVVSESGIIVLEPTTDNRRIDVADPRYSPAPPEGILDLDTADLLAINHATSKVIVGRQDMDGHAEADAGLVRIGAATAINNPVLRLPYEFYGGSLEVVDPEDTGSQYLNTFDTLVFDVADDVTIAHDMLVSDRYDTDARLVIYSKSGEIRQTTATEGSDTVVQAPRLEMRSFEGITLLNTAALQWNGTGYSWDGTNAGSLVAVNEGPTGDIRINEDVSGGDVFVDALGQTHGSGTGDVLLTTEEGSIIVRAVGDVRSPAPRIPDNGYAVRTPGTGGITLTAGGQDHSIVLNNVINATQSSSTAEIELNATDLIHIAEAITAAGIVDIDLNADNRVQQDANISSAGGAITVSAMDYDSITSEDAATDIEMADGTITETRGSGTIDYTAQRHVKLSLLQADDNISVVAHGGSIIDNLSSGSESPNVRGYTGSDAASVNFTAATGIGGPGEADIDTSVVTLGATNSVSGDVFVEESDTLIIGNGGVQTQNGNGSIVVTTITGNLRIDENVDAHGSGHVLLDAGNNDMSAPDIVLDADVTSGSGHITVIGQEHVTQNDGADIRTGGGTVDVLAKDGTITMDNNSLATTGGGNLRYHAHGNVNVGGLNAGSGKIAISSETGGVWDTTLDAGSNGDVYTDVTAESVRLWAATGVGTSTDHLETEIGDTTLTAHAGSEGIFITEESDIAVGDVSVTVNRVSQSDATVADVTAMAQSDVVTSDNGDIVLRTVNGSITISDGTHANDGVGVNADGTGNVLLRAQSTGRVADISLSADVISNTGMVTVLADDSINQAADGEGGFGDIVTGGGGTIDVEARSGSLTMADGARAQTDASNIRYVSQDSLHVGLLDARTTADRAGTLTEQSSWGLIHLDATDGTITDAAAPEGGAVDLYAAEARITARTGIGTLGEGTANPLETEIMKVAAQTTGSGGINLLDATDIAVNTVGIVAVQRVDSEGGSQPHPDPDDTSISDLTTAGNGDIVLRTVGNDDANGSIVIHDGVDDDDRGVAAGGAGNVLVQAQSLGQDVTLNADVTSDTGHISVLARDMITHAATADIVTNSGSIDVEAVSGMIDMHENSHASTGSEESGNIRYWAGSDVNLGGLEAGSGKVSISANIGSILDGGDTFTDVSADELRMVAGGGVGQLGESVDPLEIHVVNLSALAGGDGISILEDDDVTVTTVDVFVNRVRANGEVTDQTDDNGDQGGSPLSDLTTSANGDVVLVTRDGTIDVQEGEDDDLRGVSAHGSGNVLLKSQSDDTGDARQADINLNAQAAVVSGSGYVSLYARDNIVQAAGGDVVTGAGGTVDLFAADGYARMANGARVETDGGNVRYRGFTDAVVGQIDTRTAVDRAGESLDNQSAWGLVSIEAVTGEIRDNANEDAVVDILARQSRLVSDDNIGELAGDGAANPIETEVVALAARTVSGQYNDSGDTGGINLIDVTDVAIDNVDQVPVKRVGVNADPESLDITDAEQQSDLISTTDGSIVLRTEGGNILLKDGNAPGDSAAVHADGAGNILLSALGSGTDIVAEDDADVSSGSGHVSVTAGRDIELQANADVSTGGDGTLALQAMHGSLTMSPTASLDTADGDIRVESGDGVDDRLVIGDLTAANGNVSLLTTGSVLDADAAGDTDRDVAALGLRVEAGKGFGLLSGNSLSMASNPVETAVTRISGLVKGSDGFNVMEEDALTVGDITSPRATGDEAVRVEAVSADGTTTTRTDANQSDVRTAAGDGTGNGSVVIRTGAGTIRLEDGTAPDGGGVTADGSGNILVSALGSGTDIVVEDDADISSGSGHVSVTAGRHIELQANADVSTGGEGTLALQATHGSLTMSPAASLDTADGDIRVESGDGVDDRLVVGDIHAANGNVSLLTTGSVLDADAAGDTDRDVTALGLRVEAGKGFGLLSGNSLSMASNPVETAVTRISGLVKGSDGFNVLEEDALTVGDITSPRATGDEAVRVEAVSADGTTTTRTDANQSDVRTIDNNGSDGSIVIRAEMGGIALNDGNSFVGSAVSAHGGGNILVHAIEDWIVLNASIDSESGNITVMGGSNVTSVGASHVATGKEGSIDIQSNTGSIVLSETSDQETDSGDIRFQAGTNVLLGGTAVTTGNIRVTAESGWIHDRNDDNGLDLVSTGLCLAADGEIGERDAAVGNPLETAVDTISLRSGNDINLLETDDFVFDNVWVTVTRVDIDGTGSPVTDMFWIMDDGDAQHEAVGNWGRGGLSGAYEAMRFNVIDMDTGPYEKNYQYQVKKSRDYHYNAPGSGSDRSIWTFTGLVPGQYEAFTTWTPHENRATNVPFTLSGGSEQKTIRVNQESFPENDIESQGVRFQRLDSIVVDDEGTLTVAVTDDANDYVIADAVWIRCKSQTTDAPTIDSLNASPDPVTQPNELSLTAENVQDSDGTVRKVEFYRDSNNDGVLNVDMDELLGTDGNSDGGWTFSGESSGFPTGMNRHFARARDDYGAWSEAVSTTVMVNARPVPEITVLGNGLSIADGKVEPDAEDHTDFGTKIVGEAGPTRTFTVRNDGTAPLTLGQVNVPTGYTVTEPLSTSLAAGASDTFTVRLDTSSVGLKTGHVSFSNDDSDENPFDFAITGEVESQPEPEITVLGNDVTISDGDETPSSADNTEFGTAIIGQPGPARTFTVRNDGTAVLTLGQVNVPTGYSVTEDLSADLVAGASDTFTVRLDASNAGSKTGEISFSNNDGNDNPFTFMVSGRVNELPSIGALGDGPDPVTQPNSVTLTADTVEDADGSISRVEFYRDTNNNGSLDIETDELLGTDESSDRGWTCTSDTSSFDAGTNRYFARARDNNGAWSEVVSTTGMVELQPEPEVTVIGNGVSIVDGATVPTTENHTDFGAVLVGQAAPTRTYAVRNDGPGTLTLGSVTVPRGYSVTDAVSDTLPAGASDTFTVRLDTLSAGTKTGEISLSNNDADESPFTFAVQGTVGDVSRIIDDGDADFSIIGDWGLGGLRGAYERQYRYHAPGTGSQKSIWTFSDLTPGEYEVYTTWTPHENRATNAPYTLSGGTQQKTVRVNQEVAADNDQQSQGVRFQRLESVVVDAGGTLTVTLGNDANDYVVADAVWVQWQTPPTQAPSIDSLSASPNPVSQPNTLTLTASGVEDTDGSVTRVEFYRDANGNGILDVGMDQLLGTDTISNGWAYNGETSSLPTGMNQYFARAQDDYGVWSAVVSTTVIVEPQREPEITVLGNGASISDGEATPTLEDHTNFGEGVLGQSAPTRTYTVRNDGTTTLTLGSIDVPEGYTVTDALPTTLAAGASDTFTLRLDTTSSGTKTGQVTFSNNDTSENPFNFTVIGTVNEPVETTPPNPTVSTWETEPYATGSTSVRMVATTAADPSGVEYYFEETTGNAGGSSSGWQDSPIYVDSGLAPKTAYTYRVKTRDKSLNHNEGVYSIPRSVMTPENKNPTAASCSSPADSSAGVPLSPVLESSDFSDPDSGDSHQATQWQVATDSSFDNLTWDYTDIDSDKTSELVPAGTLLDGGTYYWRVRHQDNHDSWSTWSDPRKFTTAIGDSVIDDGDSSHGFAGSWSKGGLSGSYNGEYWYAEAGWGSKKSIWRFTGLAAGEYEVLASWTAHSNRATNAPFTLNGGSDEKTVRVDQERHCNDEQEQGSGVWFNRLANINVDERGTLTVTLTNNANDYVIADSVWVKPASPLLAAEGPRVSVEDPEPLTEAILRPIAEEGLSRWARAGLPTELLKKLNRTDFGVADLPGAYLGMASHDSILIDSDAAGHGWFVDSTPGEDEEFDGVQHSSDLDAVSLHAVDRIDLLTVVTHELGHIAGLDDVASSTADLMSETLDAGVRRIPGACERDAVFASEDLWDAMSN